jgi:hypothetical protein
MWRQHDAGEKKAWSAYFSPLGYTKIYNALAFLTFCCINAIKMVLADFVARVKNGHPLFYPSIFLQFL